jgi:hypothetical protein
VIGGGQVGCDYQAGAWVFGVQGMFDGSGMEGSNTDPSGLFAINSQIRSFATVTGRVGYAAAPTVLVYAKGGGAWMRDDYTLTDVTGATLANASTNPSGWTVGGGVEWVVSGRGRLAGGLLGGVLAERKAGGRRGGERMQSQVEANRSKLEAWEKLCAEIGAPPADVALAWLLHNPVVTAPIIGPRTVQQVDGALGALDVRLTADVLAELDRIFPGPGGPAPEAYAW